MMRRSAGPGLSGVVGLLAAGVLGVARSAAQGPCQPPGVTVSPAWCATVVAAGLGPLRQVTWHPSGWLIAATPSPPGMVRVRVDSGADTAPERVRFGPGVGASAVAWRDGWLYLAGNTGVIRYRWPGADTAPDGTGEWVARQLPGGAPQRPALHLGLAVADDGTAYLGIPAESNECQVQDGLPLSPGRWPCEELWQRAGVWRLVPMPSGTTPWSMERYASGLRSAAALGIDPLSGRVWAAAAGRNGLARLWGWPDSAAARQAAAMLEQVVGGEDYGWPYCQGQWHAGGTTLIAAPEYREHAEVDCDLKTQPVIGFPGNWVPEALAVMRSGTGASDQTGALVLAFHVTPRVGGTEGDRLVLVPLDGNARPLDRPDTLVALAGGEASGRLTGLAVDTQGGVMLAEGEHGVIYRLVRRGIRAPAKPNGETP